MIYFRIVIFIGALVHQIDVNFQTDETFFFDNSGNVGKVKSLLCKKEKILEVLMQVVMFFSTRNDGLPRGQVRSVWLFGM